MILIAAAGVWAFICFASAVLRVDDRRRTPRVGRK